MIRSGCHFVPLLHRAPGGVHDIDAAVFVVGGDHEDRHREDTLGDIKLLGIISPWVFADKKGNRLSTKAIQSRLNKINNALDMPNRNIHAIRKTAASELSKVGAPVAVTQMMLGHSSPSTTLRFYTYDSTTHDDKLSYLEAADL